ncbi:g10228 [Coccomyxa viridis]|uniref:G10228 protein n=1 Tax=Coccomyxa viridis TaxID=1274662 RepID=A0ABP1GBW5_9CHLO
MPPLACTLKQLKARLAACRICAQIETGAMHVALTALESVGAVTRVGHGSDTLYALNRQRFISQSAPCPEGGLPLAEGPAEGSLAAAHTSEPPLSAAWHLMKSMVTVKVPLLEPL